MKLTECFKSSELESDDEASSQSESEELSYEQWADESSSSVSGIPKCKRKVSACKYSLAKRRKQNDFPSESSSHKQRVTGVDSAWKQEFKWMDISGDDGMVCTLCRKFSRRPQKSVPGKAVWVDMPCKTVRRSALVLHQDSKSHHEAVEIEISLQASKKDGGVERALDTVISAQRKAFVGALKCMYFLNKQEIAHTTNFIPLLNLAKSLGVQNLTDLFVGRSAAYRSERFIQEIVSALGEVIKQNIVTAMQQSDFVVLMVDETTDVAVMK